VITWQGVAVRGGEGFEGARPAEDRPPSRAPRAELGLRGERQVDLQPVRQKEHADDGRADAQVPVVPRAEIVVEPAGPPLQGRREIAAHGQDQVGVRPAVALTGGERAGEGGAHDVVVGFGAGEQPLPQTVPFLDREHRPRFRPSVIGALSMDRTVAGRRGSVHGRGS